MKKKGILIAFFEEYFIIYDLWNRFDWYLLFHQEDFLKATKTSENN